MSFSASFFVRQIIESLRQAVKQCIRPWLEPDNHDLVLNAAMDPTRSRPELILENMLLRQQLIVLKRQAKRLALTWRDRALLVLLASKLPTWKQMLRDASQHNRCTSRALSYLMKKKNTIRHARA